MDSPLLMEKLASYGADMPGISDRFMGDDTLYARCFQEFLADTNFSILRHALTAGDCAAAYPAAHALCGLAGNLGLTPLSDAACRLVAALAARDLTRAKRVHGELLTAFQQLVKLAASDVAPPPPAVKKRSKRRGALLEHQYFFHLAAAGLLLIIMLVVVLFYRFFVSYQSNTDLSSASHLAEISQQVGLSVGERITSDWKIARSVANTLAKSPGTAREAISLMAAEREVWGVSDILLYNSSGVALNADGTLSYSSGTAELARRAVVQGATLAIADSSITYALPLSAELEVGGLPVTAVSVEQDLTSFLDTLAFSSFDGAAYLYLTQPNGVVISRRSHPDSRAVYNFRTLLAGQALVCPTHPDMTEHDMFSSPETLTWQLSGGQGGKDRYIVSLPVEAGQTTLRLLYVVPQGVVNRAVTDFTHYITFLCVAILLIFTATVALGFFLLYRNRKRQFDQAIVARERMFSLLAGNTHNAFALLVVGQELPRYHSSNVADFIGYPYLSLMPGEGGGYRLVTPSEDQPEFLAPMNETLAQWDGVGEYVSDYIHTQIKGVSRYYMVYLYPVEGNSGEFVAIAQDATATHDREEAVCSALAMAERSNAAKNRFLSNMSHDIRTPMNAILNMTDFALEAMDEPILQKEYLHIIQESSHHLLMLVNEVLDMSRIESGQTALDSRPLEMTALLTQVCDMVRPLCIVREQTFITNVAELRIPRLLGDQLKLSQVFINLLSNAAKYTPEKGAIRFTVTAVPALREDLVPLRFVVEDNGIGISAENLPLIFEPFMRVDDRRVHSVDGTGLGLSICKSYISAMGGTISCESEPESGSTFTVDLFFPLAGEAPPLPAAAPANTWANQPFAGLRCLLCEDNATNQLVARTLLGKIGFIVEVAEDGAIGAARFTTSPPNYYDVVYMDIQMPNMDGYQATAVIRAGNHPQAATIPIIAMTANVFAEDIEKARLAGMNAHITKPISMLELVDETCKALHAGERISP